MAAGDKASGRLPDDRRTVRRARRRAAHPALLGNQFPQLRPLQRAGNRRYYRPADVALARRSIACSARKAIPSAASRTARREARRAEAAAAPAAAARSPRPTSVDPARRRQRRASSIALRDRLRGRARRLSQILRREEARSAARIPVRHVAPMLDGKLDLGQRAGREVPRLSRIVAVSAAPQAARGPDCARPAAGSRRCHRSTGSSRSSCRSTHDRFASSNRIGTSSAGRFHRLDHALRRAGQDQVEAKAEPAHFLAHARRLAPRPRSFSGRSKSLPSSESQFDLAWRSKVSVFIAPSPALNAAGAKKLACTRSSASSSGTRDTATPGGKAVSSRDGMRADRMTNRPRSPCAADQPAERLRQPRPDHPVVIGAAATGHPPRRVKHRRARPRHALHHHQPQRFARHVDPVAQRIGAEQRGARIVAEDVDQCPGVDRVDMLGEQRQPGPRQPVGDPRMDRLQPLDRGEQAERAAARRLDQPRIGPGQRRRVAARRCR